MDSQGGESRRGAMRVVTNSPYGCLPCHPDALLPYGIHRTPAVYRCSRLQHYTKHRFPLSELEPDERSKEGCRRPD